MKINGIELSNGKILEESLGQSAFQQTLGDRFTFQQDNNLKHKAKYTRQLLTKKTLNVPEQPGYSFKLVRLENLWKDMKMAVQQWSTTYLTELEKEKGANIVQSRCAKLLKTYPERLTAVITAIGDTNMY